MFILLMKGNSIFNGINVFFPVIFLIFIDLFIILD